jgi:hypothetical protein
MRRLLFACLMVALTCAAIECASLVLFRLQMGAWPSPEALRERARELERESLEDAASATGEQGDLRYVAHPYLGYVVHPERSGLQHDWSIASRQNPLEADPDGYFVAVVGGSVAFNLRMSRAALEEELRRLPEIGDRPIVYVNLAGPGYKEPQQLIAASYYLALGGRIDVLINLDGFNEIASGIDSNLDHGVHPFYPSFWADVTRDWTRPGALEALGQVRELRARRAWIASVFSRLRFSATANLAFRLVDRRLESQIYTRAAASSQGSTLPLHSRGPAFRGQPLDDAARRASAELWARSSELLDELARAHRFRYFHFLQPNQYVPGARPRASPEETRLRLGNERHRRNVATWYPELKKLGVGLAAKGVRFVDLTGLYRDVRETVYIDDCCHFTPLGNELLARRIARTIVEAEAP